MTAAADAPRSLWADAWRRLRKNKMALACGWISLAVAVFSIVGPWVAAWFGVDSTTIHPAVGATGPSLGHWFGTDVLGRDEMVRVMIGGRIAMLVAGTATAVALIIGVSWGAIAAYAGGRVDYVMMRIVDVLYGFPTLVFVIVIMSTFQTKSLFWLFGLIGAISWLTMARLVRAQVMSLRGREFVDAARALGASPARILFRHIVPNTLGVVVVYATLSLPSVILYEAILSFLGVGVQAPLASWGTLVTEGSSQIIAYPWLLIGPGAVMALTIFALNFFGDGLRDALDPQTRKD